MAVDHAVEAVADHRAHPRQQEALADDVFALAHVTGRHVDSRDKVAAQERGEGFGVDAVVLDLRSRNEAAPLHLHSSFASPS